MRKNAMTTHSQAQNTHKFPSRRSLRDTGSRSLSNTSKKELKSRGRGFLFAASAVTAAGGLIISSVFPFSGNSGYGTAVAAAAVQDQRLILDNVASDPAITAIDALADVEVSEVVPVPVQRSTEQGLFDPSALENSEVRYPFDQQVQLTDPFGYRTAPVEQFHDAQDFAAAGGTPIRAIASGQVVEAGFSNDGCGFGLKLQHRVDNQTLTSRYCHMESNSHSYQVGDTVTIGDQAGRVGNTGMSFGPHLHLALRLNGEPIDPMPYLADKSVS